ncbi:MAG: helix-turn-helix domain-containing protein [Burkholderiaceae bacterium]|nr:helix-turn-helix domain-containing protein [Burkholderiaceae bacterium]
MVKFASKTHKEFFQEQMRDPEFAKEYAASEQEFELLKEAIDLRMKQNLSQKDIADRMGTPRSVVCRLENGLVSGRTPSLAMLKRYAEALGKKVELRLV